MILTFVSAQLSTPCSSAAVVRPTRHPVSTPACAAPPSHSLPLTAAPLTHTGQPAGPVPCSLTQLSSRKPFRISVARLFQCACHPSQVLSPREQGYAVPLLPWLPVAGNVYPGLWALPQGCAFCVFPLCYFTVNLCITQSQVPDHSLLQLPHDSNLSPFSSGTHVTQGLLSRICLQQQPLVTV